MLRLASVRERKVATGLAAAVVLIALIAMRGADLWVRRQQILDDGDRRAENLARILGGYVNQTFAGADAALRQLIVHSRRVGGPSAPESEWLPRSEEHTSELQSP